MLKFDTLTRLDAIDPLPKLGRKVEQEPNETAEQKRTKAVKAFESAFDPSQYMVAISQPNFQALQDLKNKVLLDMVQLMGTTAYLSHDGMVSDGKIISAPAEPQAKTDPDGWIEWGGGECPTDQMVQVRMRDGWESDAEYEGAAFNPRWNHTGSWADIIAYRIHKQPEVKKAAPTWGEVCDAGVAAVKRVGVDRTREAIAGLGVSRLAQLTGSQYPAAIAALNALK